MYQQQKFLAKNLARLNDVVKSSSSYNSQQTPEVGSIQEQMSRTNNVLPFINQNNNNSSSVNPVNQYSNQYLNQVPKKKFSTVINRIDAPNVTNSMLINREEQTDKAIKEYFNSLKPKPNPYPYTPPVTYTPPVPIPIGKDPTVAPDGTTTTVAPDGTITTTSTVPLPPENTKKNPVKTDTTNTDTTTTTTTTNNKPDPNTNFPSVSTGTRQNPYPDLPETLKKEVPDFFPKNYNSLTHPIDRFGALNEAKKQLDEYELNAHHEADKEIENYYNIYNSDKSAFNKIREKQIDINTKRTIYDKSLLDEKTDAEKIKQKDKELEEFTNKLRVEESDYASQLYDELYDHRAKINQSLTKIQDDVAKQKAYMGLKQTEEHPKIEDYASEMKKNIDSSVLYGPTNILRSSALNALNKITEIKFNDKLTDFERESALIEATANFSHFRNGVISNKNTIQNLKAESSAYSQISEIYHSDKFTDVEKQSKISLLRDTILSSDYIESSNQNLNADMIAINNRSNKNEVIDKIDTELTKLKYDYLLPESVRKSYIDYVQKEKDDYLSKIKSLDPKEFANTPAIFALKAQKINILHNFNLSATDKQKQIDEIDKNLNDLSTSHPDNLAHPLTSSASSYTNDSLQDMVDKINKSLKSDMSGFSKYLGITSAKTDTPPPRKLQAEANQMQNTIGAHEYRTTDQIPDHRVGVNGDIAIFYGRADDEGSNFITPEIKMSTNTLDTFNSITNNISKMASNYSAVNLNLPAKRLVQSKDNTHIRNIPYFNDYNQSYIEPLYNVKRKAEYLLDSEKTYRSNKKKQNDFYYNSSFINSYIPLF